MVRPTACESCGVQFAKGMKHKDRGRCKKPRAHICCWCGGYFCPPKKCPHAAHCSKGCAHRSWMKANPEAVKNYRRRHYERHREEINEKTGLWAKNHPEKKREIERRFKNKHKAAIRKREKNRRDKIRGQLNLKQRERWQQKQEAELQNLIQQLTEAFDEQQTHNDGNPGR